jgi:GPH family glycoside/pentoside/hexuronide:cation symporter
MNARTRLGYAAPAFALALFGVPVFVHLPKFYADTVAAPLGALGLAILLTRAGDAVLDPLIGIWSDRTETRWGRRRPFLVAAALPLGLAVVALFSPALSGGPAVWWFGVTMAVAFMAWTAVQIPHGALGAELATGHHERTALFALRDGVWMAGTLVAAAAPALVRTLRSSLGLPSDERAVFGALGLAYGGLLVALPWLCAATVREPARAPQPNSPTPGHLVRDAWTNWPYRVLILAYAVAALGGALPGTLLFFYVEHVLQAPEWGDALLAIYFCAGFAGLPAWTALARHIGKRRAFVSATALSMITFTGALFLGAGDARWFAVIVIASGAGFGATLTLPSSMLADTLDYEELRTGARREGLFTGLWGITMKASAAIGAGVALPLLGMAGYVSGGEQPPSALLAIRLLYCAVPCACYAAALLVIWRYPIDEQAHQAILLAVADRRRGARPTDPLTAAKI